MFELQEVARLYTAETGYRLVVGEFNHSLDVERTAAKAYYHLTDDDGSIYIGNTMFDLRVAIERGETTVVKNHTGLIEMILDVRRGWGITETKTYRIDADFKKAIAI